MVYFKKETTCPHKEQFLSLWGSVRKEENNFEKVTSPKSLLIHIKMQRYTEVSGDEVSCSQHHLDWNAFSFHLTRKERFSEQPNDLKIESGINARRFQQKSNRLCLSYFPRKYDFIFHANFLQSQENRLRHFTQISCSGDNLHELSTIFWENNNNNKNFQKSSADFSSMLGVTKMGSLGVGPLFISEQRMQRSACESMQFEQVPVFSP